jgi:hypothetical protein
MSDEHNRMPVDKRQAQEDRRAVLRLITTLMDPSARLDLDERATLAQLLRQVNEDLA